MATPPPAVIPQHQSTPRKSSGKTAAAQAQDDISKYHIPEFLHKKSRTEFWQMFGLHTHKPSSSTKDLIKATFSTKSFTASMNAVWELITPVHAETGQPSRFLCCLVSAIELWSTADINGPIQFYATGSNTLIDHPTGTICCPDYIAVRKECLLGGLTEKIIWPMVEFVVKAASPRTTAEERIHQTTAYLHCLMLARPDLLVGQALLLNKTNYMFFFGDVNNGVSYTTVPLDDDEFPSMIFAFLTYLRTTGGGRLDPTIQRVYSRAANKCTFNITLTISEETPGKSTMDKDDAGSAVTKPATKPLICQDFELTFSRSPFQHRTHIFVLQKDKTPIYINEHPVLAIKDQYSRRGSRFTEREIHERLQQHGKVPGVIYAVHFETSPIEPGKRTRQRMVMDQSGDSIMSAPTVKDVLYLLYDLLEG